MVYGVICVLTGLFEEFTGRERSCRTLRGVVGCTTVAYSATGPRNDAIAVIGASALDAAPTTRPQDPNSMLWIASAPQAQRSLSATIPVPPISTTPFPPRPSFTASNDGSSFFYQAHDFVVSSLNISNIQNVGSMGRLYDYLEPYIAHGAAHDSNERGDAPKCHEETRKALRENIVSWIEHGDRDDEPRKIMWLSGPAGAGKTTIAGSVAETCQKTGLLAASFFFSSFSGSAERRSKRCVITTIANHLSEHKLLRDFKAQLLVSIERNPSIFHKRLKEQAESLILEPLRALQGGCDTTSWPMGIIIDGLDEVEAQQYHDPTRHKSSREHESNQIEILETLFALAMDPIFPFRIFISSRPERIFQEFFAAIAQGRTLKIFLDAKYNPDADIARFLQAKFATIGRRFGIADSSWPGESVVNRIVDMSSGQFIIPATIVRWVEGGFPRQRLKEIMEMGRLDQTRNPFAMVDEVYRHILQRSRNPEDDPLLVVKWIICITSDFRRNPSPPIEPRNFRFWRQLLEDTEGELHYRMTPVTSLISIPPADDTHSPATIYHKSLSDFLANKMRCGDLYVDRAAIDVFLATRIVRILNSKGPAAPLSSPAADAPIKMSDFIDDLFSLELLQTCSHHLAGTPICNHFSRFLALLSEGSKVELASCDVGWWTCLLLGEMGSAAAPGIFMWHPEVLGGIYCGIHKAMGCRSNTPENVGIAFPPRDLARRTPGSGCHAACVHWRSGILAKAKELGWCVHEIQEVEVDHLESMTAVEFCQGFQRILSTSPCGICCPAP